MAPKGEEEGRVLGGTGKWKKPRWGRRGWEERRVAGHRKWKGKKIWVRALRGAEKKDGCTAAAAALKQADEALDGGGELFGSPETGRVIRFIGPTAVPAIRRRF